MMDIGSVRTTDLCVLLVCQPIILNRILQSVLRAVPGVRVVESNSIAADVIVTTIDSSPTEAEDGANYHILTRLVITIDRQQNTLYVRRTFPATTGVEIIPGEIDVLVDLLTREAADLQLGRDGQISSSPLAS
jgi:hypothetical protein